MWPCQEDLWRAVQDRTRDREWEIFLLPLPEKNEWQRTCWDVEQHGRRGNKYVQGRGGREKKKYLEEVENFCLFLSTNTESEDWLHMATTTTPWSDITIILTVWGQGWLVIFLPLAFINSQLMNPALYLVGIGMFIYIVAALKLPTTDKDLLKKVRGEEIVRDDSGKCQV